MRKQRRRSASRVTAKLISAFVFASRIVQFLFYLNLKFQASSSFLCLYSSVCVGPVRKPHCWFSQEAAQMLLPGNLVLCMTVGCLRQQAMDLLGNSGYALKLYLLTPIPYLHTSYLREGTTTRIAEQEKLWNDYLGIPPRRLSLPINCI